MYKKIFHAYQALSKGDQATLRRCSLKSLADSPAYFRVLKMSGAQDNFQTQRILFVFIETKVNEEEGAISVAQALHNAGVKEDHIIQIQRSGDNGIEYLKRQLVRCENIALDDLGPLAKYWGHKQRRDLLKNYILLSSEKADK